MEVLNRQKLIRVDSRRVSRLVEFVLKREKSWPRGVAVLVTDDKGIRAYHREYLGKDTATDVISFGLGEKEHLGDVVVSAETARRECGRYGATARQEFERYVVHGVLHLLGYDDHKAKDYKEMHGRQEKYLKAFGRK